MYVCIYIYIHIHTSTYITSAVIKYTRREARAGEDVAGVTNEIGPPDPN